MSQRISVGIDIGTYQIKVVVAEDVKNENGITSARVIGSGYIESKGLRHGYILNTPDVARSLKIAITQAERTSKIRIKRAYVSIGGIGISGIMSKGSVMISKADSEITDLDVRNVLAVAEEELSQNSLMNKKIVHAIPVSYKIDGQVVIGRPAGMRGTKLEVKALFVTCLEQHLNDLIKAVEEAGVEVLDVMASPLAASIVSLTKVQKIAGCVLANIGSETVSIVVFENNTPISLEVFPIGSTDITNDIALGFKIPIDEAEHVKMGSVLSDSQYPRKKLEEIILARLSDIFDLVEVHLKKIGRSGLLPAGIVLTGGGASLSTIEEIAKDSLKLPSKVASINFISNIKNSQLSDSSWSVAYGLAVWGISNSSDIPTGIRLPRNTIKKMTDWFGQFLP
ncbi:MAG: cell division protein FtsA [Candidatus Paceibacterota bacterium]|jgi:cell division protein FtsA